MLPINSPAAPAGLSASPPPRRPVIHKHYLPDLGSLRAIAALSVCLFHCTNGALPKAIVPITQRAFSHGTLGADIFFVISGFIIPYSMLGKNHQVSGFLAYLKKRVIRINPPAYAAILLVLAQWFIIDRFIQHGNAYTKGLSLGQLVSNLLFAVPSTPYTWIVGVFWTLAIDFQFYIFIGLLFGLMFERHHSGWFLGCCLLINALQYVGPGLAAVAFCQYSTVFALGGATLLWQQQCLSKGLYAGYLMLFTALAYWQLGGYVAGTGLATALAINLLQVNVPGWDLSEKYLARSTYCMSLLATRWGFFW